MEASFTELGGQEVRTAGLAVRTVRRVGPSLLRGVQLAVVALAATVAVALGVLPNLGLYRTLTVLSGSMVPTFRPGDIVVVRSAPIRSLRVGDVITYQVPVGAHQVETHRVIQIVRGFRSDHPIIRTEGDANDAADPWTTQLDGKRIWRLEAVIPKAGYALNMLRGRIFHLLSVIVIPALLAAVALRKLWRSDAATETPDA